ncbi:MAG: hypothetical protein JO061_19010 [Acidobacteriaceae bacterium]|nr:hypothetical protein [Acidobacteriaceae bacterium]
MTVLDLFERGIQFAFPLAMQSCAENLGDLAGGQAPESELATTFEELVNRESTFEDEVAAILDLTDGIEAAQIHGGALTPGKFRAQQ